MSYRHDTGAVTCFKAVLTLCRYVSLTWRLSGAMSHVLCVMCQVCVMCHDEWADHSEVKKSGSDFIVIVVLLTN